MRMAVFGAGLMGSQIGCEYALHGHDVTWVARSPLAAQEAVRRTLEAARGLGLAGAREVEAAQARLRVTGDPGAVGFEPDLVLESVVEDLPIKTALLRDAALRWPGAILASNTSSLSISRLGEGAGAPERVVGTHYVNPPMLVPIVELVSGTGTSEATIDAVQELLRSMGKQPVRVERDVPGFIFNRLQFALLREALWLADNGVATPAAIDEVVRDALARRSRHTGPFESAALGGLDTFSRIASNLFGVLSTATEAGSLAARAGAAGPHDGTGAQRRDEALAEELAKERGRAG
jgi:3-hydroxybutyryl-CoA dehydrogenase